MTKHVSFEAKAIALSKLTLHPQNVRAVSPDAYADADIAALAANIAEYGLIQPLLVQELDDGRFGVLASGRRLHALLKLQADKVKGYGARVMIPCSIVPADTDSSVALSLSENEMQLPMGALDRFEAFVALHHAGSDVEKIARSFGISERVVKESLRLGNIHADIRAAYREGAMTLDALKAFDGHPDQSVQLEVYQRLSESGRVMEWQVKRAFSDQYVRLGSELGQFVLAEYKAAGGTIILDLIDEDSILEDDQLIAKLLETKLSDLAEEVREDLGFAWADHAVNPEYDTFQKYGRVYPETIAREDLSEDATARVLELETQITALEERGEEQDGLDEADEERHRALVAEYETLTEAYDAIDLEYAGVMVTWKHGRVEVLVGLVRPEDRAKHKAAKSGDADTGSVDGSGSAESAGTGGASSQTHLSEKLTRDLAELRTRAVAIALAQSPDLARDYADFVMIDKMFAENSFYGEVTGLNLSVSKGIAEWEVSDKSEPARAAIEEVDAALFANLATDWVALDNIKDRFAAFRGLSSDERAALLAYVVSKMLEPCGYDERQTSLRSVIDREALVDIREAWTPDSAFFGRLKKPDLLKIIREDLLMPEKADAYANMKKSEIVNMLHDFFNTENVTLTAEQQQAIASWAPQVMWTGPDGSGSPDPQGEADTETQCHDPDETVGVENPDGVTAIAAE